MNLKITTLLSFIFLFLCKTGSSQTFLVTENFTGYTGTDATTPAGWYLSAHGNYVTTQSSGPSGPNSFKFADTGVFAITPKFIKADSLQFWHKGNTTDTLSAFYVLETADSITWDTLAILKPLITASSGILLTFPVDSNSIYIQFIYIKSKGNVAFDNVSIFSNNAPPPSVTANFSIGNACPGDFVQFTDNSITTVPDSIISWLWNFGDGGSSTDKNPTHYYSVNSTYNVKLIVTSSNSLIDSMVIVYTPQDSLSATYTVVPSTCGGSNGSATVSPTGGSMPYTYSWDPSAQTTATANGLNSATSYTATVTDVNGCTFMLSFNIQDISGPSSVSITENDVVCNGAATGSMTATPSGGISPYEYLWSDAQTTSTATGLISGTYSVTVTDSNGCTAIGSGIIEQPVQMTTLITANDTICIGDTIGLTASTSGGNPPFTYSWSNGFTGAGPNNVSPTATAIYSVSTTDSLGCQIPEVSVNITVSNSIVDFTDSSDQNVLSVLPMITGDPIASYFWEFGDGSTSADQSPAPHSYSISGTYKVCLTATNNNGCIDSVCKSIVIITTSSGTGIKDDNKISIYPNPSKGKFFINSDRNTGTTTIKIYDLLGNEIRMINCISAGPVIEFDLGGQTDGIYLVRIISRESSIAKRLYLEH